MRLRLATTGIVWAIALTLRPVAAKDPNIVLVLADDQGWTGTSVVMDDRIPGSRSDYYRTPALERLAGAGMRFSDAYAPHPNCSPTRMSIQTGKSPVRLGSTDIIDVVPGTGYFMKVFYERFFVKKPMLVHLPISGLPEEEVTIAEFIKKAKPKYIAGHFGKWHMDGGSPSRHGYDVHDGETTNAEGREGPPNPKRTPEITKRALAFLERQAATGKPFYLQISYYAVHTPVVAMPETIGAYKARPAGQFHNNAGYGAMTEELDRSLGAVLAKLDELGLADNTFVIYTSDNGGEVNGNVTSNKPLARGKTHVWEGGVRVPLVIRGPGIKAGSVSHVPVIGWDFFPTIAEWLGISAALPANIDGGSLREVLLNAGHGEVKRPTQGFVWYYPHYRDMKGVRPQAAIRLGDDKLIKELETGQLHLFNLARDIGEEHDLAAEMPDRARELEGRLERYLDSVGAKRPTRNPDYDPNADPGLAPGPLFGGPDRGANAVP